PRSSRGDPMLALAFALSAFPAQDPGDRREAATAAIAQGEQRDLRLYDVGDLIDPSIVDFEAPELGVSATPRKLERCVPADPTPQARPSPEAVQAARVRATEALAALIQAHVEPALDPTLDKVVRVGDGSIAIQATAKQQAWITGFLHTQREFHGVIGTQ